ncbi:hypothetical protein GDO81_026658 [Engystomops pustulosus]|uniref:Uncharacterized protein n=1 Tax=Engystomops pustulosus TaxID=76066 RepID=A0AAV6YGJ5_ENGPU|nr:hypothetical protein GDO81_026658 [Engystomops pustulosus]
MESFPIKATFKACGDLKPLGNSGKYAYTFSKVLNGKQCLLYLTPLLLILDQLHKQRRNYSFRPHAHNLCPICGMFLPGGDGRSERQQYEQE